jgi:hypothetical protein
MTPWAKLVNESLRLYVEQMAREQAAILSAWRRFGLPSRRPPRTAEPLPEPDFVITDPAAQPPTSGRASCPPCG